MLGVAIIVAVNTGLARLGWISSVGNLQWTLMLLDFWISNSHLDGFILG